MHTSGVDASIVCSMFDCVVNMYIMGVQNDSMCHLLNITCVQVCLGRLRLKLRLMIRLGMWDDVEVWVVD